MAPPVSKMTADRLQKVMAKAGVASRRASEILIERGKVKVNGVVVTELGTRVDPAVDRIEVEGVPIQVDTSMRYVMLNKPLGVLAAGLLFGGLRAGAVLMQANQAVPIDIVLVVQSLIVLFIAAPPLVRAMFFLRRSKGVAA